MNAKQLVSIGLASILWFGTPVTVDAQSNWPTPPGATVTNSTPPAKSRTTVSRPKRRNARKSSTVPVDVATLRALSENIARQTLALEALTLRLEAAEHRLDNATPATTDLSYGVSEPFRSACTVDWPQVLVELDR